jgi:hypothetical protein
MSRGIARVTSSRRKRGIPVSHAFVVTGEDECIEAAFPRGVVRSSLAEEYFHRADRYVIFRKPKGLNADLADRIVRVAQQQVGAEFDHRALVGAGLSANFVAALIDRLFGGSPRDFLAQVADDEGRWICSELVAFCLDQQPEFRGRGVLQHPSATIGPQWLFESEDLFAPLVETLSDGGQLPP